MSDGRCIDCHHISAVHIKGGSCTWTERDECSCVSYRPAVARPDQGDGDDARLWDSTTPTNARTIAPVPPAVDPAHGAEEPRFVPPPYESSTAANARMLVTGPPATPEAVVADLRAGLVDGVQRAQLVEAVARWLYENERDASWDDAAKWVRADWYPIAEALLADDGPLGKHLAQAAADRAAVLATRPCRCGYADWPHP